MKKRMNWKKMLAVLCVAALMVGVLPVSGFAMEAYQQAIAEYQAQYEAALRQQIEQHEAAVQAYREADGFNVEAVFEYLIGLRNPDEQKELFRSLNDRQKRMLVEYMLAKAEKGEFKEFYNPEFALKDEIEPELKAIEAERGITITRPTMAEAQEEPEQEPAAEEPVTEEPSAEEPVAEEPSTEEPAEAPALTEEEQFALDYAPYIEMYEKYGTAGNYYAISYDAFLKIQAMFSTPVAEEDEAPAEEPAAEEIPVEEATAEELEGPTAEKPHELTEEEFLLTYYSDKVELYKEHRQFAQLNLDYETEQRIKAYVDEKYPLEPVAEETTAEEVKAEVVEEVVAEESPAEEAVEEVSEAEDPAVALPEESVAEDIPAVDELTEEEPVEEELPVASLPDDAYILPPEENPDPKEVTILSSLGDTISLGEPVILTGVLEDAEDFTDVIYIWEVDKGSGEYEAVADANGPEYSFPATIESLSWNWRLRVLYR